MPNGGGTVSIAAGVATFSSSQDGVLAVDALLTVAGIVYRVTARTSGTVWSVAYVATPAPSSIADLAWHLDASSGVSVRSSGGVDYVTQWNDQAANAWHVTQATAAYQPQRVTNALAGRPVLRFDGAATALSRGTVDLLRNVSGWTVVGVRRYDDGANALRAWLSVSTATVGTGRLNAAVSRATAGRATIRTRRLDTDSGLDVTAPVAASGHQVESITADYTAPLVTLRTEGGQAATATPPATGSSSNTASAQVDVGAAWNGSAYGTLWKGDIAAVLAYHRALTDTERWQVEAYLAQRYGLGVTGPQAQAWTYHPPVSATRAATLTLSRTAAGMVRVQAARAATLPLVRTAAAVLPVAAARIATLPLVRAATLVRERYLQRVAQLPLLRTARARVYWLRPLRVRFLGGPRYQLTDRAARRYTLTDRAMLDTLSLSADHAAIVDIETPSATTGEPSAAAGLSGVSCYLAATRTGAAIHDSLSRPAAELAGMPGRYRADHDLADLATHLQPYVGRTVWEVWARAGDLLAAIPRRVTP